MTAKSNSLYRAIKSARVDHIRKIISIVCFFALLAVMAGCKKDKGGQTGEYYIKFKANGTQRVIDYVVTQDVGIVDSTTLQIGGKKVYIYSMGGANANAEGLTIGFYSETRLVPPRTFNEAVVFKNTSAESILQYTSDAASLASGQLYTSIGAVSPVPAVDPEYASITRDVTVSISEYTSTYISGTFSGTVYLLDMGELNPAKKISITGGEFKLKLP